MTTSQGTSSRSLTSQYSPKQVQSNRHISQPQPQPLQLPVALGARLLTFDPLLSDLFIGHCPSSFSHIAARMRLADGGVPDPAKPTAYWGLPRSFPTPKA